MAGAFDTWAASLEDGRPSPAGRGPRPAPAPAAAAAAAPGAFDSWADGVDASGDATAQAASGGPAARRGTMRAVAPYVAQGVADPARADAEALGPAPGEPVGLSAEWGAFDQLPEPADKRPLLERPLPEDLQNDPGVRRAQGIEQSRSPAAAAAGRRNLERQGELRRGEQQFRDQVEATREGLGGAAAPLGDVGTAAAKGVFQTAGLAVDALRMLPLGETAGEALTSLSSWARLSADAAQRAKSPESRAQWRELQTILQDDSASIATVLGFLVANPGIALEGGVESGSTMVPVVGAGKLGGELAGLLARRMAANPATAATARELGASAGIMGSNAAMGAGSVYAEALRNGSSQADALAAAGGTALAYALAGRLTRGGAEGALVQGRTGGALATGGREIAQEGLESLGESAGAALTPEQDFDPGQAARQATLEAALAAGPGVVAGAIAATPYDRARAVGFNVDPPLTTDTPQAQRRKIEGIFDDLVAAHPLRADALQAVRERGKTLPLNRLGRFYSSFVAALQKRGAAPSDIPPEALEALGAGPIEPAPEAAPELTSREDQLPPPARDLADLAGPAPEGPDAGGLQEPAVEPSLPAEDIRSFSPASGTLGIPREDMPQIAAEHRGALIRFLNARGIGHESDVVDAGTLRPTQSTFNVRAVRERAGQPMSGRSVLVSADGHILDGHHQALAAHISERPVKIIRLRAPIRELLPLAREFPSSAKPEPFPRVEDLDGIDVGPGGRVSPRPIASGKPLYRETSIDGLDELLRADDGATVRSLFVADSRDLARGQGSNRGVFVTFRPGSLSGAEYRKPGSEIATGQEFQTDMVAPRAVQAIEMDAAAAAKLSKLGRRALAGFEKRESGDGRRVVFVRKGLQGDQSLQASRLEGLERLRAHMLEDGSLTLGMNRHGGGFLRSDRTAIFARAAALRGEGMSPDEAGLRATEEQIEAVRAEQSQPAQAASAAPRVEPRTPVPDPAGPPLDDISTRDAEPQATVDAGRVSERLAQMGYEPQRAPTVQATRRMRGIFSRLDAGSMTEAEAVLALRYLAREMDTATSTKAANRIMGERQRGPDLVREKLLRARRQGDLDPDAVEFALWALDQNPAMAESLGISVRSPGEDGRGIAGQYNPAAEIVTLIKGSENTDTAVHEILHHTERMMPPEMQAAIREEWARALAAAFKRASPEQREALGLIAESIAGDAAAHREFLKAIQRGPLSYEEHYQLANPSEFWAVNATRLLQRRFESSDSVWSRLATWLAELLQKLKSLAGLRSDAPVLRALSAVLESDGTRASTRMLSEREGAGRRAPPLLSFAGPFAQTANLRTLAQAERMLAMGFSPEDVRQDTGWFKGSADGRWRFEINDSDAKLARDLDGQTLGDVLDHPALFAAYPALRDTRATVDVGSGKPAKGRVSRATGDVTVSAPTRAQALSILLHEVQHGIQTIEGFARGGSGSEFRPSPNMTPQQMREAQAEAKRLYSEHSSARKRQGLPDVPDWLDATDATRAEFMDRAARSLYMRLAGEVEARNTQTRQGLDERARRAIAPSLTADVADTDVIVRFNGRDAESAPPPENGGGGGRRGGSSESASGAEPDDGRRRRDIIGSVGRTLAHWRGVSLQVLGRRQLVELYQDDIPQLRTYSELVQKMDAERNDAGAQADEIARDWAKLKDERALASVMHDATLEGVDPSIEGTRGPLRGRYQLLSKEAKEIYRRARDAYREHFAQVEQALGDRIRRADMSSERRQRLLAKLADNFKELNEGVYFPLSRFGSYVVLVRNTRGDVVSVSRAETLNEAEELRKSIERQFKSEDGASVSKVLKDREYSLRREGVSPGFLGELYETLEKEGVSADLMDDIGQLYLSSLPDLSWAKHGIHRKKTPGFSQDARRSFASYMFHGASYVARVRYADQLQSQLDAMQKHVEGKVDDRAFDSVRAQQVVDEMVKRHDLLMNPKTHPLSTALTSLGFVWHLGLSPASALVNMAQTPLVAYPLAGAKWGYARALEEFTKAMAANAAHGGSLAKSLKGDEADAYREAVRIGLIDVTLAHDLAGIAAGEDAKVQAKLRPVMRVAAWMFHKAEVVNREVTFMAGYRLARKAGADPEQSFEQAVQFTYDSHFDYGASNRPRFMQGNWQRVIFLFKQFAQNMIFTLVRQAQLSLKGTTPQARSQARKALAGMLLTHAAAAGVLGLPVVGTLLKAASMIGTDEDEPWEAETALRNYLADVFGQKPAEVLARGLSRLTPWDISSRVGLDRLILPDVWEGLEGQRAVEAWFASALGPVAGIAVNVGKGLEDMAKGHWGIGLESMMPSALRGPLRAYRLATEGAQDRSGVPIVDEFSSAAIVGQALGLSPSELRNAQEGRAAVFELDRALSSRRQKLLADYARAEMGDDEKAIDRALDAIDQWNEKQPDLEITVDHMDRSVEARENRIDGAEDGIFLPESRSSVLEAGRFARRQQP